MVYEVAKRFQGAGSITVVLLLSTERPPHKKQKAHSWGEQALCIRGVNCRNSLEFDFDSRFDAVNFSIIINTYSVANFTFKGNADIAFDLLVKF